MPVTARAPPHGCGRTSATQACNPQTRRSLRVRAPPACRACAQRRSARTSGMYPGGSNQCNDSGVVFFLLRRAQKKSRSRSGRAEIRPRFATKIGRVGPKFGASQIWQTMGKVRPNWPLWAQSFADVSKTWPNFGNAPPIFADLGKMLADVGQLWPTFTVVEPICPNSETVLTNVGGCCSEWANVDQHAAPNLGPNRPGFGCRLELFPKFGQDGRRCGPSRRIWVESAPDIGSRGAGKSPSLRSRHWFEPQEHRTCAPISAERALRRGTRVRAAPARAARAADRARERANIRTCRPSAPPAPANGGLPRPDLVGQLCCSPSVGVSEKSWLWSVVRPCNQYKIRKHNRHRSSCQPRWLDIESTSSRHKLQFQNQRSCSQGELADI